MKIGSLFSGYGGLDLAVEEVFGATTAWHVERDAAPAKILAHHWPDVPNHRDVTTVDWTQVEPVDVLTGGTPCQDLSQAGKRAGMTEGTRSNLWVNMREAINVLRPQIVVWENVLGALSATATSDSDVEPGKGLLGGVGGHLRALGRVTGDLSEAGYDCRWTTFRASDVGAPHHRARVFLIAQPTNTSGGLHWNQWTAPHPSGERHGCAAHARNVGRLVPEDESETRQRERARTVTECGSAVNAPDAASIGPGERVQPLIGGVSPTPGRGCANPADPEEQRLSRQQRSDRGEASRSRVDGSVGALPDPGSVGCIGRRPTPVEKEGPHRPVDRRGAGMFGRYAPAVRRWERVLGRPAPAPTELNSNGRPRLNAAFAEWMMGLPTGWVTGVDIPRTAQLKAIGNGVCPQQAAAALRELLALEVAA